jgi:DNA-directed RNA polymerase specialized sigma24 family protein
MNIDGDQPAERSGSTESVRDLRAWAGRVMGGALLRMGLPKAAVETILEETFRDLAPFEKSMVNPRTFIVKLALRKAAAHRKLRGLQPAADPDIDIPHLLALVRTHAALAALPANARSALWMLFQEKKSFGEVAAELDVSIPYVQRLVKNALRTIRQFMPPRE